MTISYLHYDLHDGFIHNWLLAGPHAEPIGTSFSVGSDTAALEMLKTRYDAASGISEMPVERGPLTEGNIHTGSYEGAWSYFRCCEDHLVGSSTVCDSWSHLQSWAYVQLEVSAAQTLPLVLSTRGPADVWINGTHIHRQAHVSGQLASIHFDASLIEGRNEILVRFEALARGPVAHQMALRLLDSGKAVSVILPTTIENVRRRNNIEHLLYIAALNQAVYGRTDEIIVRWPETLIDTIFGITVRFESPSGRIYAETDIEKYTKPVNFGPAYRYLAGPYRIHLMASTQEYYLADVRVSRDFPIWSLGNAGFSIEPYGTLQARRVEALRQAAGQKGDLSGEIAKMAISWWSKLDDKATARALDLVRARGHGHAVALVGLMGMVARYGDAAEFPPDLLVSVQEVSRRHSYMAGPEGPTTGICEGESEVLLYHTAELLAGQMLADQMLTVSGKSGHWHRARAEAAILAWLEARATAGFGAWSDAKAIERYVVALVHLVDFAETQAVWEGATILLDKLLFNLAADNYHGIFGTYQNCLTPVAVPSTLLSPVAGVSRLMWGQGIFNHHTAGVVSLACSDQYALPRILQDIAHDQPEEVWHRQRHAPEDLAASQVTKMTYKTPDAALTTVQCQIADGSVSHAGWEAVLSPTVTVFVTHSGSAGWVPDYQSGCPLVNVVPPRVTQWKDVAISIYDLPEDDWMGLTYASFPIHAFDEFAIAGKWAFVRVGDGYLALMATQGMQLVADGPYPDQQLRSAGSRNIWLCHLGRRASDGEFDAFKERILGLTITVGDLTIECETLRGDTVTMSAQGEPALNGDPQPLQVERHYESPYCGADLPSSQLDIHFSDQLLRLQLENITKAATP